MANAKKKEVFDLDAVLAGAAKKTSTKKSSVPVVSVPDKTRKEVAALRAAKEAIESAKAEAAVLEESILTVVEPLYDGVCRKEYSPSVKVEGADGMYATVTWPHKYSKIDREQRGVLEAAVGEDYEDMFEEQITVALRDVSEETVRKLVTVFGPERFQELFVVERWITPTHRFTEEKCKLNGKQRTMLETVVIPQKATFRTK